MEKRIITLLEELFEKLTRVYNLLDGQVKGECDKQFTRLIALVRNRPLIRLILLIPNKSVAKEVINEEIMRRAMQCAMQCAIIGEIRREKAWRRSAPEVRSA